MKAGTALMKLCLWTFLILTILFIFLPSFYLLVISFEPSKLERIPRNFSEFSIKWYIRLFQRERLPGAIKQSIMVGLLTAVITSFLSLFSGLSYRKLRVKSYFLGLLIFPMFVPGIIAALSLSVFFKLINIRSSIYTVVFGHVLYALPYATIVTLVSFSGLKEGVIEAARDLGANGFRAFKDIIFPLTRGGIFGGALFGFLLSLNEFIRAYFLSGWQETLSIYMFGQMKGGADPSIYALAGFILSISILLVLIAVVYFSFIRHSSRSMS
ncbi:MAG: ABC transporter permease [Spirochaetes bacterium]|nr:ABC transporter permease [Spirochaetota bacterium]